MSWYWHQVSGNVLAMPACGLIAIASAVLLRKPIASWWHRHFGSRATAEAALRIAADLHHQLTGSRHPDAPEGRHGP